VHAAELACSRNGNHMVKLTLAIQSGQHKGRWLFDQMMLTGSPDAIETGKRRMKELLTVIGHPNPNYLADTDELLGGLCQAQVAVETQTGYAPRNVVKYYAKQGHNPQVSMGAMAKAPSQQTPPQRPQQAPPQQVPATPQAPAPAYQQPPPKRTPPPSRAPQTPPQASQQPETAPSLAEDNVPF
jgi:hypothetical protein